MSRATRPRHRGDLSKRLLRTEVTWAKLCGVAPLAASSGKVIRYRDRNTGCPNIQTVRYLESAPDVPA